jgi:glycosyltransferase involved in cell wall biosynthesis
MSLPNDHNVSVASARPHTEPQTMKRRITDTGKSLRVLMVLAADGTSEPPIWATRQIESLRAIGVQVHTYIFQNRRTLSGLVKGGLALRRKAREYEADLIHVHYGAAQALATVLFSGKPVIVSFCGSDLLGNYDSFGRKTWSGFLSGFLSQLAALGCRRCIAKTEELKNALWFSSCRNKCDVIPNGVDLNQFKPMPRTEARSALGWAHNDPVVLFMDRSGDWVKDPQLAQAAYNEAKKCVSSLRMHVVEQEPPEKMHLFYNAADVLLLTSRHEGSNNTVKEALACNLPVVATACGDISERLHGVHGGYVCTRDRQQLGRWLAQVVTSRERGNGRELIQELALHRVAMRVVGCYLWALDLCSEYCKVLMLL